MKLYYKAGACSLASHIALEEIGRPYEIEAVDTAAGKTAGGDDFRAINPKGYVPALKLENGDVLTEGAAILQVLADGAPEAELAPKIGDPARAKMLEHLVFVSSELHKAFSPLFRATSTDEDKAAAREAVAVKLDHIETELSDGRAYLIGDQFTIADAYLFVVTNWANFTGIDLAGWPKLAAYVGRVASRPASQAALRAEGLLQ